MDFVLELPNSPIHCFKLVHPGANVPNLGVSLKNPRIRHRGRSPDFAVTTSQGIRADEVDSSTIGLPFVILTDCHQACIPFTAFTASASETPFMITARPPLLSSARNRAHASGFCGV